MRKLFVTGIGTDVGKTVASAILVEALKADYWKPVQTGSYFSTDSDKIRKYITNTVSKIHPESYVLRQYMSPHAAAELEDTRIELDKIVLPETSNTLIIEGAGGLMVPLNEDEFILDLILKFDAEVVVVIQNYLGSINHTLLTLDVLRFRKVPVAGLIFNGPPHQLSEDIIIRHSGLRSIGRIMKEGIINQQVISKYAAQFDLQPV
ncbi:MAG: dethiobiotin synthase [Bacteroidia bacterium]